jgi:calcium-dependent protein kinase
MLKTNPMDRCSASEALTHAWFSSALKADDPKNKEKLHSALDNFRKFNSGNKVKQAALGFMI